jgi:hypothetical protein
VLAIEASRLARNGRDWHTPERVNDFDTAGFGI